MLGGVARQVVFERLSLDERHDEVGELSLLAVGQHRHDILVLEHAHLFRFLAEASDHGGIARELRQDGLESADAADGAHLLAHLVDDAHAAEPDDFDDLEFAADFGSRREDRGDGHR